MTIQKVSNPSFQGRVIYLTKNGEKLTSGIQKKLPYMYEESQALIKKALKNEPFDVYISRGESHLDFNILASNGGIETNPILVKLEKKNCPARNHGDYYNNPDDFVDAIYASIRNFNLGNFKK